MVRVRCVRERGDRGGWGERKSPSAESHMGHRRSLNFFERQGKPTKRFKQRVARSVLCLKHYLGLRKRVREQPGNRQTG